MPLKFLSVEKEKSTLKIFIISGFVFLALLGVIFGQIGPKTWEWERITLLLLLIISTFIVITVQRNFIIHFYSTLQSVECLAIYSNIGIARFILILIFYRTIDY